MGEIVFRAACCLLSDNESNLSQPFSQLFVLLQELIVRHLWLWRHFVRRNLTLGRLQSRSTKHRPHTRITFHSAQKTTSTQYDNYLLSWCRALFVTLKLLWLFGVINSSRMDRTESVQNLPQNPYDTTHLTLVMLLHYLGKLKIRIFCNVVKKCL